MTTEPDSRDADPRGRPYADPRDSRDADPRGRPYADPRDGRDADPRDGREETANERSDRNWTDILQELRVTQTATQILSGFLLTLAFQQRFSELDSFETGVYLSLVVLAAAATALGLAPVSLHRTLFRRHEKARMVAIGNGLLEATLVLVSLLSTGVVFFVFDFVLNLPAAVCAAAVILALLACLLVVLPRIAGRTH